LPFEDAEIDRALEAADRLQTWGTFGPQLRAMILLLRHSGLRIQDAACLERARLNDDKLFLYTQKTGETTVKNWNRVFQKLFATCDPPVVGGHPHRFRDTFAISLLLRGAELPNVSILLGHSSIRVTERHYSPWVKARQEQLEADVRLPSSPLRIARNDSAWRRRSLIRLVNLLIESESKTAA